MDLDFKSIDHVGWITKDIALFEKFWVELLGFKMIKDGVGAAPMMNALFGINKDAVIRRYSKPGIKTDVEIHYFEDNNEEWSDKFYRPGINHVCLFIDDRDKFIEELPEDIKIFKYDNPGGWQNVFVMTYEGDWVELRANLGKV